MPKATKVGKFRSAARASSRDVRGAPLTSQFLAQKKKGGGTIKDDDAATADVPGEEKEALSRGQRKRLAKRDQYLKREKMVMSSLRLQRLEEQKGRLDGLDAIREALLGSGASSPSKSMIAAAKEISKSASTAENATIKKPLPCNTNKSKKTLANTEISHMGLVLEHPSFKEDPFAAIQAHLRNSLAPDAEKLKEASLKRDVKDKEVEAKKKEEKKERLRDAKYTKGRRGYKSNRAGRI